MVNQALTKIASKSTGKKILQGISSRVGQVKFGFTVCIQRANMTYNAGCETKWVGTILAKRADEISDTALGKGSVTAINITQT